MKKFTNVFLLMLIVLFAFTACSKGEEKATSANQTSSESLQSSKTETEDVVLRVVDWSDSSLAFREAFHKKFEENHPGVKIEYTCLTQDQFNNTVVTLLKSGDAPDVFPIPSGKTLSMALKENWYQPMNQYLDEEFISSVDPSVWIEGVTTHNGEIYTLPENLPVINSVIYYNKDLLAKAGITKLPTTYSEFINACKKVSEIGNGQFYGWIEGGRQLNRLDILVRAFASKAGGKIASSSKVLTVDGKAPYDSKEVINTMNLFKEIVETGGMHPDTINISAPEAREFFAQGQAAFLVQGMWCISTWEQTYPDLNYGVMDIPVPDELANDPYRYGAQQSDVAPWLGIYKESKNPELAAEYIKCLFSVDYGYQAAQDESGSSISIIPAVNDEHLINPVQKEYYTVATRNTRVTPVATSRDAKVYDFYAEVKDVSPNLGNIFQGVLSESINDVTPLLKTFSENSTKEWKRACEAIGLDFSVFEFSNWDLSKDYTSADYSAL